MIRALYNLLLHLAMPAVLTRLWWRGRREPGYREDWAQRFGRYAAPVGDACAARQVAGARAAAQPTAAQPLIWLHAVSLGETLAAQPLIAALRERYPAHRLLVTHMTATGREAAQRLYGEVATLAFLPYDLPWAVARFFAQFAPVLGIVMETEVWPNLARAAAARGVPLLLANARMSPKSHAGYLRAGALLRTAFGSFDACAQTAADGARLTELGARSVLVTGNLKFDTAPVSVEQEQVDALRRIVGAGRVFLAASTREGEEALLLDALARHPLGGSVIVVVPRHPQRFDEVAALLARRGIVYVRRSENRPLPAGCQVVLGDSMGEMPAYYALADCAFIGGSLVPLGGQNMIEAAALGVPALFGPHTFNFSEAAQQAVLAGAALRVDDADALCREVASLLSDAARRDAMGAAGRAFCAGHRGATGRTMEVVGRLIDEQQTRGPALAQR